MRRLFLLTALCSIWKFSNAGGMDNLPAEIKEMLKNLHNNCIGESGATEDVVVAVNKGEFKDDKTLKCYMKCLVSAIGVMDDDGNMDWDAFEGLLPDFMQEFGKKTRAKCSSIRPSGDACETAFLIQKCSYEADPANFLLF